MKFDTSKDGLLTMFKPYQVALIEHIWDLNSETRIGLTSGKAYMFLQGTGDSELKKSRASVIFSLNDMVDDGILEYEEESGKGGYHRVYYPKMNREEFAKYIKKTITDKLVEVFPSERVRIQIPLREVQCGIYLSRDLGLRHLNDARTLIKNGSIEGAAILTIFGIEEYGRILILKERYLDAKNNGTNHINIKDRKIHGSEDAFYNHRKKQNIAKNQLPKNITKIHQGSFGQGFSPKHFDVSAYLDQDLRNSVNYIDYCDRWQISPAIDVTKLESCINEFEKKILAHAQI